MEPQTHEERARCKSVLNIQKLPQIDARVREKKISTEGEENNIIFFLAHDSRCDDSP